MMPVKGRMVISYRLHSNFFLNLNKVKPLEFKKIKNNILHKSIFDYFNIYSTPREKYTSLRIQTGGSNCNEHRSFATFIMAKYSSYL